MSHEDTEGARPGDEKNEALRICHISLDEDSLEHANPDIEHERRIAIFDLLEDNYFAPVDAAPGPYNLHLSIVEKRLVFDIRHADGQPVHQLILSLSPFRRIIKDYFMMCDSYYDAIRNSTPSQIEAIDMGRRGLHNEGSEILRERLQGKVDMDFPTSRRLFTLICVLHINV